MGMTTISSHPFAAYLTERKKQGLYRKRMLPQESVACLDFSCNDYLSLANDAQVRAGYLEGFANHAIGSGGSLVLCGYHPAHRMLEQSFAKALGVEDCLLFSSGYVANLSVMSLLLKFGLHPIVDKAVHASIYDGLSQTSYTRFFHNNLNDLQQKIEEISGPKVIITESTFSMSGLHAPLAAMSALAKEHDAYFVVDEAHGFGVLGPQGLGGIAAANLSQTEVPLRIIPFGKAMAGSGALVAGQAVWIDALLQATRQPIYSTSISPAYAYGLCKTLEILLQAEDRRRHLYALIHYFRDCAKKTSFVWRDSVSPIQQLQLGCPFLAQEKTKQLADWQIRCFPIRQPTVPKAETGLRIILNHRHQFADIDKLFLALQS